MPPRTTFTREAIASAAIGVVRKKGLHGLTVRLVAKRLGSSIAPVYSVFRSMDGLEREVLSQARDQLLDYARRPYTDLVFLNMGVGICTFAREEPWLFRALFLESGHIKDNIEYLLDELVEDMRKDEWFASMPRKVRMALLTKMWTYTHGLATMICLGVSEESGDEFITQSLRDMGRVVTKAAIADFEQSKAKQPPPRAQQTKRKFHG